MNVLINTLGMSREEWLAARKKGIGGSDAAAVCGLDPWKSPMGVWLEKTDQVGEDEEKEAMYWGKVLEEVVADEFVRRTGMKVRKRNAILQHPDHLFMLCNVDRIITDQGDGNGQGLLECKTANAFRRDDYQDAENLPYRVQIQVQHSLAVTGLQWGYVAVLIGGNTYRHFHVERDDDIIAGIIKLEKEFWQLVESQTAPPLDGSDDSSEIIAKKHPVAVSESVELPTDTLTLVAQYEDATEDEKAAKWRKEEAANKLKELLGDYERGWAGERKVIWSNVSSRRLDTKRLKEEKPEVFEEYAKESHTRRFTIK